MVYNKGADPNFPFACNNHLDGYNEPREACPYCLSFYCYGDCRPPSWLLGFEGVPVGTYTNDTMRIVMTETRTYHGN
jgi:hypothetical protein